MIFKLLISAFILSADLSPEPDADGWVAIERPEKNSGVEGADERDPSIWVVFSKQIGPEKILISFPDEPTYRYMDVRGELIEVRSASRGAEHRLQVLQETFKSPEELLTLRKKQLEGASMFTQSHDSTKKWVDLMYWKEGFWHFERLITTDLHTYFLQTTAPDADGEAHHIFIHSFNLENDRKYNVSTKNTAP